MRRQPRGTVVVGWVSPWGAPGSLLLASVIVWLAACGDNSGESGEGGGAGSSDGTGNPGSTGDDGEVVYEGGMAGTTLGVVAGPECMRVGTNLPANGAYWSMAFASGAPSFVMCCLDGM